MNYDINYRGMVISITINEDKTKITYTKNSNEYILDISDRITSKLTKNITIPYSLTIKDSMGVVLSTSKNKYEFNDNKYNYFYNLVANRSIGDFLDRGSVNSILEHHFNEQVYPFNITKNYDEMQPIIFDNNVVETTLTIDVINYTIGQTLEYSLDGNNFQTSNIFNDLENGSKIVYVKSLEDGYIFSKIVTI